MWMDLLNSQRISRRWMEWCDEPRSNWSLFNERLVVVLVLGWLCLMVTLKLTRDDEPVPLKTGNLIAQLVLSGGIAVMLLAILLTADRPASEYGLATQPFYLRIRDGIRGYLLSLLPMAAMMLITLPMRTPDKQNPLLRLLIDNSSLTDITLICILAVIIAPACEELMFRVILQGWLTGIAGPAMAIPIVVVVFAAIHGLADGIALIPLAAVLGYVFHRRHSYLSVVVIHALFNGTMVVLQVLTHMPPQLGN